MQSIANQAINKNNLLNLKKQFSLISLNLQKGNYIAAEKLALLSNTKFPNNEHILRALADIYERQNKKYEAINIYLQLIETAPQDLVHYNNLGILYLQIAQLKKAEDIFRKASDLNSNDFFTQYNLGITLIDLGKFQEAELSLIAAKAINSSFVEVHNKLGFVKIQLGKLEDAELCFKHALMQDPKNIFTLNSLGVVLKNLNKFDESKLYLEKSILHQPNNHIAHFNLGLLYKENNDLKKAELSYLKSIAINPSNYNSYNNLGNVYTMLGYYNLAIKNFITAIELKPYLDLAWQNIYIPLNIIKSKENYNENYFSTIFRKKLNIENNIYFSLLIYKLNKGGINSKYYLNKIFNSFVKDKVINVQNIKKKNNIIKTQNLNFNKIIALLPFGRSGTGLLHSLIDNHSEVSTLPSIYFSQFFDKSTWEKIIADGFSNVIDNFIKYYPVFFDSRSSYPVISKKSNVANMGMKEGMTTLGINKNEFLYVNKNLFKKELNSLIIKYEELDQITFFELVHIAYEKVINNYQKKNILFYHIHNPKDYALFNFINFAPNTRCLVMVRQPIESCESWINTAFKKNDYYDVVIKIVAMLFDVDNALLFHKEAVGLRLEDLKSNPQETLSKLCTWMGIKEEKTLYEMTAQGKKWWGDMSTKNQPAFGEVNKSKVGNIFSKNDRFILNTLFYPFSVAFGYEEENLKKFISNLRKIRPMLNEIFDFEEEIISRTKSDIKEFKKSEMFIYLRAKMIERWDVLKKFNTYPNMLKPLK